MFLAYSHFARTSRTAVEIGGRTIRPGEAMALAYASANRDEAVFENPDAFIINRANISKHIAFRMGPHRCVGMPVARLELVHALRAFVERVNRVELIGEIRMSNMPEVGPISVPVRVSAASLDTT